MSLEAYQPRFDRSAEDIFRELRERIPLYNRQWTNYNDADPGITLLQLFAWLADMTLHRMNDVPRHTYLKFAALLGLELPAARPARVALAFTPRAAGLVGAIPERARYAARAESGTLIFETVRALDVIGAPLAGMFVFADGTVVQRELPTQPQAQPFWPLGRNPVPGDALYLAFKPNPDNPRPFPRRMAFLALRPETDTRGQPQRVGVQAADLVAPVGLVWEYRPRADRQEWERLAVDLDESAAFTRDGFIGVEGPQDIEPTVEPALSTRLPKPHYWLRVRLEQNTYAAGRAPRLEHLLPNAVEAENLTTQELRVLGTSNGRAAQFFNFPQRPVDAGSLRIELRVPGREPDGEWQRVEDLLGSKPPDKHFVLNATAGRVQFGDGDHGLIPPAGADIVATVWRHGGGAAGNSAAAGAVSMLIHQAAGIEKVINPRAASGGSDEQPLADFIRDVPRQLKSGARAVTSEDFEVLATSVQGVKRARALGERHPGYPEVQVPGALTVFIVADTEQRPPAPSAELIRSVCRVLDKARLVTTEVHVAAPRFLPLRVEARLLAAPEAAFDQVANEARKRLDQFLDPLRRGFGEDVSPAALYATLLGAMDAQRQVRSVGELLVYLDGVEQDIHRPVVVPPDALVYPGHHLIVVRPDTDEQAWR